MLLHDLSYAQQTQNICITFEEGEERSTTVIQMFCVYWVTSVDTVHFSIIGVLIPSDPD